jgi:hypothetical protein
MWDNFGVVGQNQSFFLHLPSKPATSHTKTLCKAFGTEYRHMIRGITLVCFLAVVTNTFSQTRYDSLKSLSRKITLGITSERKKLEAILYWVTENIEYDVASYHRSLSGQSIYPDFHIHHTDSIARERAYDEAIACLTIFRRKGVCDGYARLFKSLCIYAGIQCVVVNGKAKTILSEQLEGHAWNAVRLEGKWQLVDPTWASGYVNGDTYTKRRNLFYFLTAPQVMFINHLPDEQKWTLLDKQFNATTFGQSPIEDVAVIEKGLMNYNPKKRDLKVKRGQPIALSLEFDKSPEEFSINISASGWPETRASRLNIPLTDKVYDSLYNLDPDYFKPIEKVEIISKKIIGNKVEFVVKPLTDITGIDIHVDYGFTALSYDITYL